MEPPLHDPSPSAGGAGLPRLRPVGPALMANASPNRAPPPDSAQTDTGSRPSVQFLLFVLPGLGLLVLGLLTQSIGVDQTSNVDEMSVNWMPVTAAVSGKTMVTGEAIPDDDDALVAAHRTEVDSIYAHYEHRVWVDDRSGDGEWETVEEVEDHVSSFLIRDETGEIAVAIDDADASIFDAEQRYDHRDSDDEYTEHRIEPGDTVVAVGDVQSLSHNGAPSPVLRPAAIDSSEAVVTNHSLEYLSRDLQLGAIFALALGLALSMGGLLLILRGLRSHHAILSMTLLCVVAAGSMLWMGLQSAYHTADYHWETAQRFDAVAQAHFDEVGAEAQMVSAPRWRDSGAVDEFDGISTSTAHRLHNLQWATARALDHIDQSMRQFPTRLFYGPLRPYARLDVPTLSDTEVAWERPEQPSARPPGHFSTAALVLFGLIFILYTREGFQRIKIKRLMEQLPITDLPGITYGLTSVRAAFAASKTLEYSEESMWRRIVGPRSTSLRQFRLLDGEHEVEVRPDRAKLFGTRVNTSIDKIPRDTPRVYVLGDAVVDPEQPDRLIICGGGIASDDTGGRESASYGKDEDDSPFVISSLPPTKLHFRVGRMGLFSLATGFWGTTLLGFFAFYFTGPMTSMDFFAASAVTTTYFFACLVAIVYNDLVFAKHRVERARANIETALKKRHSTAHSLATIVKKFVGHERQLMQRLTALRRAFEDTELDRDQMERIMDAEAAVTQQLQALSESYPELKSGNHFQNLMNTLTDLEDEVQLMRDGYNDAVEHHNTLIEGFPELLMARLLGMKPRSFLHPTET